MPSRQKSWTPAIPTEILEESATRPFRDDLHLAAPPTSRKMTEPCPLCGATNSLTDTAVRLGNLCDDCLEGDTDVGAR